jgi:hypothetical protein
VSSLLGLEQATRFATTSEVATATSQGLRDVFLVIMRLDFLREGVSHGGVCVTGLGDERMIVIHLRERRQSGNVSEPDIVRP